MSVALTAQNYQFLYDYSFAKDSLNMSEVESEIMSLMVRPEKKQSLFAVLKKIKSDSTMVADESRGGFSFPDPTLKVVEIVEKNQGGKRSSTPQTIRRKKYIKLKIQDP